MSKIAKQVEPTVLNALESAGFNTYGFKSAKTADGIVMTFEQLHKFVDILKSQASNMPPGEPVFVVRAQDASADTFVDTWAEYHSRRLGGYHPKILEAKKIAEAMRQWPTRKQPD